MLAGPNDILTAFERDATAVPQRYQLVPFHPDDASLAGLFKDISRCVQELCSSTFNGARPPSYETRSHDLSVFGRI